MADAEPVLLEAPLDAAERAACLDLVAEIQRSRAGAALQPEQVPHILLPYQVRWHQDTARVRIAEKSRRIGWSWGALAAEAVLEAAAQDGMDQFYMGYNKDMAAEFIGDCAFFARAFQAACARIEVSRQVLVIENERRDIIRYRIEFASGHRIEALSSNPHNWRGKQGHARIDEAAFHPNLREVVKGALAFLMWGGRVDIVSTHNGEESAFNDYVKQVKAGKLNWSLHRVDFDRALADGFFRRVCLVNAGRGGTAWSPAAEEQYRRDTYADYPDQDDANEELGALPKRGAGVYIPRALIERCWEGGIPVLRLTKPAAFVLDPERKAVARAWLDDICLPAIRDGMPAGGRTVFGQDFGRSGDLSVIWTLRETAPGRWRTVAVLELRNIPFDIQQTILFGVIDALPNFAHGKLDARGNGQSHAEAALQRYGPARIDCVMFTALWYGEHFPKYRTAYEERAIVVPMSEDLAGDHRRVVMTNGRPGIDAGKDKGSDGGDRHGDGAVAGVLAWAATLTERMDYGYRAAGTVATDDQHADRRLDHGRDDPWVSPIAVSPGDRMLERATRTRGHI